MEGPATNYPPANTASHSQMTQWDMMSIMNVAMAAHEVSPYKHNVKRVCSCSLTWKCSHCMQSRCRLHTILAPDQDKQILCQQNPYLSNTQAHTVVSYLQQPCLFYNKFAFFVFLTGFESHLLQTICEDFTNQKELSMSGKKCLPSTHVFPAKHRLTMTAEYICNGV